MKRAIVQFAGPAAGGMLTAAADLTVKLRQQGLGVHWLPWPRQSRHRLAAVVRTQTAAVINDLQPAIVHAHGLRAAWFIRTLVRRGMIGPFPLVTTLHSFPNHDPTGRGLQSHLWRLFEQRAPLPDRYICVSRALGQWFRQRRPALAARTVVIAYGAARPKVEFFDRVAARRQLGLPVGQQCQLIGAISRCSREKGLDLLVDSFRRLQATDRLGRQWRLVIVGDGPDLPRLRRQVRRADLTDQVHFTGHVPQGARHVRAFDIFVVPSRSEGLGLTAVDALAAGVPVVAARIGGLVEVLDQGRRGVLVTPFSAAALAEVIAQLAADEAERQRLGAAGPHWAARAYPPDRLVSAHRALYETVLTAGRGDRRRWGPWAGW